MGVYKLSAAGTLKTGRTTFVSMLAGNPVFVGTAYESIQTVTVGSGGQTTISFTSIPSTYKHLQLRYIAKWNYTVAPDFTNTVLNFNSDLGTNYAFHSLRGNGSVLSTNRGVDQPAGIIQVFMPSNHSSEPNVFGSGVIDILDYANVNKYKTVRGLGGFDRNGSGFVSFASVLWQSTSAVTSINITSDLGLAWTQHSSFALYGIRG